MGGGGGQAIGNRLSARGIGLTRSRNSIKNLGQLASARRALAGTNWSLNAAGGFVTRRGH